MIDIGGHSTLWTVHSQGSQYSVRKGVDQEPLRERKPGGLLHDLCLGSCLHVIALILLWLLLLMSCDLEVQAEWSAFHHKLLLVMELITTTESTLELLTYSSCSSFF